MKIKCDCCGEWFEKRPSAVKAKNYCCKEHRHLAKVTLMKCDNCGKEFEKWNDYVFGHNFCCRECAKAFTNPRMSDYNRQHNPEAVTDSRRQSLRKARLNTGEGKTYEKTFGRHTHRIVAEQMIGRPLKPGEVVHHINENKRDNRPENLMVFASQADHARWHIMERRRSNGI